MTSITLYTQHYTHRNIGKKRPKYKPVPNTNVFYFTRNMMITINLTFIS